MARPPQKTPGASIVKTVARRLSRIEALLFELQFTLERNVKRIGQLQAQVDELAHTAKEALKKAAAAKRTARPARQRPDGETAADTLAAEIQTASGAERGPHSERPVGTRTRSRDRPPAANGPTPRAKRPR